MALAFARDAAVSVAHECILNGRSVEQDFALIQPVPGAHSSWRIDPSFLPGMRVPGYFFVNDQLKTHLFGEYRRVKEAGLGSQYAFLPALCQIANVATLPGIVKGSFAMPDVHSGYGFPIGGVAAFNMNDSTAVVSPGGVGFDINCGVRLLRTNLMYSDIVEHLDNISQSLFNHIPAGVGTQGVVPSSLESINNALQMGQDFALTQGYAWAEDAQHCEENGRMLQADADRVSARAKHRGKVQIGTMGAGNHYTEVQIVDEIIDPIGAAAMGIESVGQVCIMIHSGSRGLGHQVATDSCIAMCSPDGEQLGAVPTRDPQLACARINSPIGQHYLSAMAAAANFAWCNRSYISFLVRQTFAKAFTCTPDDLDMALVYDVSHNIAKTEQHIVDGRVEQLLVHRKGATRAFPPHHPLLPTDYQHCGQPVLIGGTMGTASYILLGRQHRQLETSNLFESAAERHDMMYNAEQSDLASQMWSQAAATTTTADHIFDNFAQLAQQHSQGDQGQETVPPLQHESPPLPFYSTCHGAGRVMGRFESQQKLQFAQVLETMHSRGVHMRVASPNLIMEEAPESYKDVDAVISSSEQAQLTSTAVRLRPVAVIKG